jgi:hypothetical protein
MLPDNSFKPLPDGAAYPLLEPLMNAILKREVQNRLRSLRGYNRKLTSYPLCPNWKIGMSADIPTALARSSICRCGRISVPEGCSPDRATPRLPLSNHQVVR